MAAPEPARKLTISATAVVCADAVLEGDVTIGDETVVQPGAVIRALGGPIVIGQRNIVEERATIVYSAGAAADGESKDGGSSGSGGGQPMVIGSLNVFEVGCHVENSKVGRLQPTSAEGGADVCFAWPAQVSDFTVVEAKAKLNSGCAVGRGCVIGELVATPPLWSRAAPCRATRDTFVVPTAAGTSVPADTVVPDGTVVYYLSADRRTHMLEQPACRERNVRAPVTYSALCGTA